MIVGSVIPMVVEQDGRWERSFDIYSRLLRERIVFLGQEVNDDIANLIAAQLLHLDAQDPGQDIYLYVNSPGGSAYAAWRSTTRCSTCTRTCRPSASAWG